MRRFRPRLTYANVVSTLCLFILLGGTAWAVAANSVGTAQLKNGAVTNPKIAANAVGTGKVADHSLFAQDFAPGQVGPRQFDVHVPEDEFLNVPEVNGLRLLAHCKSLNPDNHTGVYLALRAHSSVESVGVSGFGEINGTFHAITAQDEDGYLLVNLVQTSGGGVAANFDVLARNVQSPNKWTHWVIGLYNDGSGHGCGLWGNISPPSN
jgi:hypothetical protein